jgi:hypothetical protein
MLVFEASLEAPAMLEEVVPQSYHMLVFEVSLE